MTSISLELASTHDHWLEKPRRKRIFAEMQLGWRHFVKAHPPLSQLFEWTLCTILAAGLAIRSLTAQP
jgi:hypothetical protein